MEKKYLIIGGAGFIGSNFVEYLLSQDKNVVVLDNFTSGKKYFMNNFLTNLNFNLIEDDVANWNGYKNDFKDVDTIIHLASNADIAAATVDPTIDFYKGTLLTQYVAELARACKIPKILYASGSGVYGDRGHTDLSETDTQLKPISPYGASKLAGEAILSAYSYMFGIKIFCFRFANVVGKNQTHGVALDFINNLTLNPLNLRILGNGKQSKSYIHISDLINAVLTVSELSNQMFDVYNVSNNDQISVLDIAEICIKTMGLNPKKVNLELGLNDRGWAGDVPIVKLNPNKLLETGWKFKWNSKQAMELASESIWQSLKNQKKH